MSCLPGTEKRTHKQEEDEVCKQLKKYCQSGWPNEHQVQDTLKPYYSVSAELTMQQGILMCNRIVVPSSLCSDMLTDVCTQDTKELQSVTEEYYSWCGSLVSASNWKNWLRTVSNAAKIEFKTINPCYMAKSFGCIENSHYLLVIDYFSRYIEIAKLNSENTTTVIKHMKSICMKYP